MFSMFSSIFNWFSWFSWLSSVFYEFKHAFFHYSQVVYIAFDCAFMLCPKSSINCKYIVLISKVSVHLSCFPMALKECIRFNKKM